MSNPFSQGSSGGPPTSAPALPRRLSYASVLAGNSPASTPSAQQPVRAGFFAQVQGPTTPLAASEHNYPFEQYQSQHRADDHRTRSPLFNRRFSNSSSFDNHTSSRFLYHNRSADSFVTSVMDRKIADFFVPSYLAQSRHVERLEERYKARLSAQSNGRTSKGSNTGSLSTSASSMSLHKMVPSHRGMTHEIVERAQAQGEEFISPLPSKWNYSDKFGGLEIYNDGMDVKFNGVSKTENEAAAIRADHPMPRECGMYYYEVTILGKAKEGFIGVGFSGAKVALNRPAGWESDAWAYHGDDGLCFSQTVSGKPYGPKFGFGDVIGCGVNFRTGHVFFTKNGVNLGTAFREVRGANLYPSISLKKAGEHVRVNFGQSPFVFDIDNMLVREKNRTLEEINKEDSSSLHEGRDEGALLQELIAQYLAHDGYIDTAKAFAEEVREGARLLHGSTKDSKELEYKEDLDAINRQKIRAAVLDGDVDKALKYTTAYYPSVLQENENIYFKLRCRKFIEMIRKCTDMQAPTSGKKMPPARSNGASLQKRDSFDGYMDVDDPQPITDLGHHGMDVESSQSFDNQMQLMNEALRYGQELQLEFKDDPRREVKQALEDTFALIAYPDARESSLAPLLELDGRIPVAEELNSAILVSLGKSSSAALERLYQQTEVLMGYLGATGGSAALVNVRQDYLR